MSGLNELTPEAHYARGSSHRRSVYLSMAAQFRDLRDYAERNGYMMAREYAAEDRSGRIANRPQFQRTLCGASKHEVRFQAVWDG